jgi:hypothetical protein
MEAEARMILAEAVRQPKPVDLAALRAFMERLCEGSCRVGSSTTSSPSDGVSLEVIGALPRSARRPNIRP